jgi:hypothetical protein
MCVGVGVCGCVYTVSRTTLAAFARGTEVCVWVGGCVLGILEHTCVYVWVSMCVCVCVCARVCVCVCMCHDN